MDVVLTGIEPEVKPELEALSERTSLSARAEGHNPDTLGGWDQGEVLAQNFRQKCRKYPDARLRFYMDCGRHHTDADHFHKPKDPKKPLTFSQIDALRIWFQHLPTSACAVMNFAMANWPRLREQWKSKHPSQWDRIQTTPTISALERYGSKELLDSWKAAQGQAALNRVAQNVAPITDDYYQQSVCNQLQISEVGHGD